MIFHMTLLYGGKLGDSIVEFMERMSFPINKQTALSSASSWIYISDYSLIYSTIPSVPPISLVRITLFSFRQTTIQFGFERQRNRFYNVSDAIWGDRTFVFYLFADADKHCSHWRHILSLSLHHHAPASACVWWHLFFISYISKSIKIYSYLWKRKCDKLSYASQQRLRQARAHPLQDQCSFGEK